MLSPKEFAVVNAPPKMMIKIKKMVAATKLSLVFTVWEK